MKSFSRIRQRKQRGKQKTEEEMWYVGNAGCKEKVDPRKFGLESSLCRLNWSMGG